MLYIIENLIASTPNSFIKSSGSGEFPRDFDIFLPISSLTIPWKNTFLNGIFLSSYIPNIIILATQKNMMSAPVTNVFVG